MEWLEMQIEGTEAMKLDGFDDCLVGVVERFGGDVPIVCYDRQEVIDRLVEDGVDETGAVEYYEFNIYGAWVGPGTPCFLSRAGVRHYMNIDDILGRTRD